jgi:hypothetical protein
MKEDNHGLRKRCIALAARRTTADHSVAGLVLASLKVRVPAFDLQCIDSGRASGDARNHILLNKSVDHNSAALIAPDRDFV